MAYEVPGYKMTLVANEALTTPFVVVTLRSDGRCELMDVTGANNDTLRPVGVLQEKTPASALADGTFGAVEIMVSGITKAVAGGTVTTGKSVGVDTAGKVVERGAATDFLWVIGTCIVGGAVNELITVMIDCMNPRRNQIQV
jgi:hypothetical protein